MKKMMKKYMMVRDEASDAAAAEAAAAAAAAAADKAKAGEGKSFTQVQVNAMLAEERRKNQARNEQLATQLKTLQENSSLTQKERDDLAGRIEQLQSEFLTKEELSQRETKKRMSEADSKIKSLETEASSWKDRYASSTIERVITDAAVATNAFSPAQIVALLRPSTKLVEELDDSGKPKGTFVPKVKFEDVKEGKSVTLDLTVQDAVKRMSEMTDKFGNLFKNGARGGVGGGNQPGAAGSDKAPTEPGAYREWRKTHPLG